MSKKNGIIRWSESKKKQRDQERADADALKARQNAAWAVTEAYKKLKKRLIAKKSGRTKEEADNFLLDLRLKAKELLKDQPDAQAIAIEIIDENIAKAKKTGYNEKNLIRAYIPNATFLVGSEVDPIAKHNATLDIPEATFSTYEELKQVPFVKRVTEQKGFIGLVVDWPWLGAFFSEDGVDEPLVKVGYLSNSIGLGTKDGGLPTWEEFRSAWLSKIGPENPGKN